MVDRQDFAPAATDLVDGIAILLRRATNQLIEARHEHLLQLGEQRVNIVFHLERLHCRLIHMLHTTTGLQLFTTKLTGK